MNRLIPILLLVTASSVTAPALARDVNIEVINLTHGIHVTPLLLSTHPDSTPLFQAEKPASALFQALAEGGDISSLASDVKQERGAAVGNPASGMPGVPGIPAGPVGDAGADRTGVASADTNTVVHANRGVVGDTDLQGGMRDLDSRVHRWLNPVARAILTIS